ncbi:hypothetical protein BS78_07G112800 [Paspalum vaginatum]|nr:hypothetical protein BS78_07G112800 [Paspalum vaginatum]
MQDQDVVGKVVEISIECANGLGSLAAGDVLSKDIVIGDHEWTVLCCPRGAPPPGAGAGEFLSVQFVNRTNASNALVHFLVIVLGRAAAGAGAPPTVFCSSTQGFEEYPSQGPVPRKFSSFAMGAGNSARCYVRTRDLVDMCGVCGHITVTCGVTVLRHNLTPVPESTYLADIQDLREKNLFGEPDVKFAFGGDGGDGDDGSKKFSLHRRVLSARSPVLKAQLEGSMAEGSMAVIRPGNHISVSTFVALVVYLYHDRLPKASECRGYSVELFRQLLAAADWYGIERLKLLCARKLWDDYMSVHTVCKTLWYARTYNCQKLRKACEEYIAAPQNKLFAFSEEFHWLRTNATDLFDEIHAMYSRV